ncbi:EF-hand domain-containing protein [Ilumatobacter sp.]|uniref:EF-hand domain-containing protein n=1 Tax=Ilumatobacter sp. TaxID=1967498 RepID=UPI0037533A34
MTTGNKSITRGGSILLFALPFTLALALALALMACDRDETVEPATTPDAPATTLELPPTTSGAPATTFVATSVDPADAENTGSAEFLAAFGAQAQDGVDHNTLDAYATTFDRIDADGDGIATGDEYVVSGHFGEATARAINAAQDFNDDGKVTVNEYVEHRVHTDEGKAIMLAIDTDGDQELTLDELINSQILSESVATELFGKELDTSANGAVTVPEWLGTWGKWVWGSWLGPDRVPAEQ